MRLYSALLSLGFLSVGFVAPASATTFEEFGRMNMDDASGFVALEVQASADYLKAQGHPEQADKVIALFHQTGRKGGVFLLADNIKTLYATNRQRDSQARTFDARPYEVEDAIALTLRGAGINVPVKMLMKAGDGFRPSGVARAPAPADH